MDTRSHKEQVYDRQLRLWGVKGQEYLEHSHLGVFGSSVSECEVLKNLVLPGIGRFTILDDAIVEERDIGKNFFLQEESLGRPRAEEACALLCEMNPYVCGNAVVRDPVEVIQDNDFLSQFTLVVVSNSLTFTQVMELDESLRKLGIPMVMVRSLGFFGFVRISHPLHTIYDAKKMLPADLRVCNPFPELEEFFLNPPIEEMDESIFFHTPMPVVLRHALNVWRKEAGLEFPTTSDQKKALQKIIRDLFAEHGVVRQDILEGAFHAYQPREIPPLLKKSLEAGVWKEHSDLFFVFLKALHQFVEESDGVLPLEPKLPDLDSDTGRFLRLQGIFQKKFGEDKKRMRELMVSILERREIPISDGMDEMVDMWCRNVRSLGHCCMRSLAEEERSPNLDAWEDVFTNDENHGYLYLIFKGVDAFRDLHGRYPGETDDEKVEEDAHELHQLTLKVSPLFERVGEDIRDVLCKSYAQYGGCELHPVASFVGALGSQECIKIITHQLIPLQNTFVYNGMAASGSVVNV